MSGRPRHPNTEAILAAYLAGDVVKDICARFGCNKDFPATIAKGRGLAHLREPGGSQRKFDHEAIASMRRGGSRYKLIARALGCSHEYARQVARKEGAARTRRPASVSEARP